MKGDFNTANRYGKTSSHGKEWKMTKIVLSQYETKKAELISHKTKSYVQVKFKSFSRKQRKKKDQKQ